MGKASIAFTGEGAAPLALLSVGRPVCRRTEPSSSDYGRISVAAPATAGAAATVAVAATEAVVAATEVVTGAAVTATRSYC